MSDLLNKASLVMVPSGYKEDTVYSVVPSDGSGDLSFTRASNGTRVNSAGLVEVAPWNMLTYSQLFSNGAWIDASTGTVTRTSGFSDPIGGNTAFKLVGNNASSWIANNIGAVEANNYTFSIWLKTDTTASVDLLMSYGTTDTSTKSITSTWQRYEFTASRSATAGLYGGINVGNGVNIYAWGAQLNIGSTAKPYFPTTDRLNVPRLTYQNGGCPSLLLEKQSTNLITYSQQFTNPAWSYSGTITDNVATSPDGTQNAAEMSNSPYVFQGGSFGICTVSCYFKKTTANIVAMRMDTTSVNYIDFNIGTGVVGSVPSGFTASIESVGNGWYRCIATATASVGLVLFLNPCYIWGAQVEASSYATSYIPTTSSSATRVADDCGKSAISSLIGQTEGVLFVDLKNPSGGDIASFGLNSSNTIYIVGDYNNSWAAGIVANSVNYAFTSVSNSASRIKIALAYKSGDSVLYINGVQAQQITSSFSFSASLSAVRFFPSAFYFSGPQNATYNQVAIFKTRLTNAELASLTTI